MHLNPPRMWYNILTFVFTYVPYSQPNGWPEWAETLWGNPWVPWGNKAKIFKHFLCIFLCIFLFHGQRPSTSASNIYPRYLRIPYSSRAIYFPSSIFHQIFLCEKFPYFKIVCKIINFSWDRDLKTSAWAVIP